MELLFRDTSVRVIPILTRNLTAEYENDKDICRTRESLWTKALKDKKISEEQYYWAKYYYGEKVWSMDIYGILDFYFKKSSTIPKP